MARTKLGALLWILCLQYFVAEAVAISGWSGAYSFRFNYISDLGALGCSAASCSPLHAVMNGSFLLQGMLIVVGTALLWPRYAKRRIAALAMAFIGASGVGVFLVGLAPEDALPPLHYFGAGMNFVCCHLGMATMGASLLRGGSTLALGAVSLGVGLIGLTGIGLLGAGEYLGLGVGTIERIVAYPFPLWLAGMGVLELSKTASE
jgi:hypothetical membrane protein